MIVIKFSVYNQRLRRITSGIIPSNAYGKIKFEFDFRTDDWDVITIKTVNFYYSGKNYYVKLDKNNQCYVPKQVLHAPAFNVSVCGGDLKTNYVKNPVENVDGEIIDSDNNFDEYGLNILDGGAIILDITDDPSDGPSDPPDEQSIVDYIIENSIPLYSGIVGEQLSEIKFKQLNTSTTYYTDQGFYTTTNADGKITNAGYQITFRENEENIAQTFAIYSDAKIVTAYQYQPAFNQWLEMGFDEIYWIEYGNTTQIINGQNITYTTYVYNAELMGDVITAPEYWRFEVEVL